LTEPLEKPRSDEEEYVEAIRAPSDLGFSSGSVNDPLLLR
jgi:hypothetical protein